MWTKDFHKIWKLDTIRNWMNVKGMNWSLELFRLKQVLWINVYDNILYIKGHVSNCHHLILHFSISSSKHNDEISYPLCCCCCCFSWNFYWCCSPRSSKRSWTKWQVLQWWSSFIPLSIDNCTKFWKMKGFSLYTHQDWG